MKSDVFQIMPNHVHAVIHIDVPVGATLAVAPSLAFAPSRGPDGHNYGPHAPDFEIHELFAPNDNPVTHGSHESVADHELSPLNTVKISGVGGNGATGAGASPAPTGVAKMAMGKTVTLGDVVGAYKSLVANDCLKIYKSTNKRMGKLWQRNYYDHIIRDDTSLYFIRKYIRENPMHWIDDIENHIDGEIDEFDMEEVRSSLWTSYSNPSSTGSIHGSSVTTVSPLVSA